MWVCYFVRTAMLARTTTALQYHLWVGSIVCLDTHEERHVYEMGNRPVERRMGYGGLGKVRVGRCLVS